MEEKLEKEKVNSQIAVRKNEELLNKERQRNLAAQENGTRESSEGINCLGECQSI